MDVQQLIHAAASAAAARTIAGQFSTPIGVAPSIPPPAAIAVPPTAGSPLAGLPLGNPVLAGLLAGQATATGFPPPTAPAVSGSTVQQLAKQLLVARGAAAAVPPLPPGGPLGAPPPVGASAALASPSPVSGAAAPLPLMGLVGVPVPPPTSPLPSFIGGNNAAAPLAAAPGGAAGGVGQVSLLQSPLLPSAYVGAQAAQDQQKQAETLQKLKQIEMLQQILADNERKKAELKKQSEAQSVGGGVAAVVGAGTAEKPVMLASSEIVPEAMDAEDKTNSKSKSPEEVLAAALKVAKVEAQQKAVAEHQEIKAKVEEAERLKCHLHKKPKDSCKFCKKHRDFVIANGLDSNLDAKKLATNFNIGDGRREYEGFDESTLLGPIEIANKKTYGFPTVVQSHILDARYYENTLMLLLKFDEIIAEANKYVKSVEPYMPDSTTMPTPFLCVIYRLFTLSLDGRQIRRLIDRTDNPYLRCLGFVYLRFGLHPEKLWAWLGEYVTDDEEFQPSGSDSWSTIGDFVEALLIRDKYYTTLLPRVSGGVRQMLERKLAPIAQYRKRVKANREIVDVYEKQGTRVEVCLDGMWHDAIVTDFEEHPSRPKVQVRLTDGNGEEVVDLGRIILQDDLFGKRRKVRDRSRSRSKSRDRIDWTRSKGKTDAELLEELRANARERAVCGSGKDYGRRPTTFDKGLAMAREGQGVAARRLLEEETFIKMSDRRRGESPPREQVKNTEPSIEHQEKMRKVFEKYGAGAKPKLDEKGASINSIEGPDKLRLG